MKSERLYAAIGAVEDELLIRCEAAKKRPLDTWLKYGGLVACFCFIVLGAYVIFHLATPNPSVKPILHWSSQFSADDYFKYNNNEEDGVSTSNSLADIAIPYAETRSFSDIRSQLESDEVIPAMVNHPLFDCLVNYNEDGSIYSLIFSWHRRGNVYSDLSITAGYQAIEQVQDCILIELDENGNIIEPAVTITERDGIQIVAAGNKNRNKTITFQNERGWYQIEGSWNDSYEAMVLLLDWIWEHPIDFERFTIEAGDSFTYIKLTQMPDAFIGYIPNFSEFGFIEETDTLTLKNGEPYAFEANYVAHADAELVKVSAYYDVEGWTNIHWYITTAPDYYDLQDNLGELHELTEQMVLDALENNTNLAFTWAGYFIRIYSNTPQEVWAILE